MRRVEASGRGDSRRRNERRASEEGRITRMTIRTDRLVLRPFAPEDGNTLFAIFRDDGVRRFLLDGVLVDRDWVRGEIDSSMRRFAEGGLGIFLARDPTSDEAIGFAGFRPFRQPPVLELLYGL